MLYPINRRGMACEFRITDLVDLLWELHQHLKRGVTKGPESLPVFSFFILFFYFFYSEQNPVAL